MKARQFVNVVMRRYGRDSSVYSVSRIKPEEQLFYPCTKEAQAAAAPSSNKEMETLSRMPAPRLRLERSISKDERLDFLPLYERGTGGYSKILCIDDDGSTVLCDTDAGVLHPVPCLSGPKGANPVSFSMVDRKPMNPARADALYILGRYPRFDDYFHFEALMYTHASNSRKGWGWLRFPPPAAHLGRSVVVGCHALLDDPSREPLLIVSSTAETSGAGTYFFNTFNNKWFKAGGWTLPFVGRAEHVPELDNLWFGIAKNRPYHLCAVDLRSFDSVQAPPLVYKWQDLDLPDDSWVMTDCSMVYLGGGKFCIARIFEFWTDNDRRACEGAVISGLEVVRHTEPPKLVMVKHKSKFYKFTNAEIQCIL